MYARDIIITFIVKNKKTRVFVIYHLWVTKDEIVIMDEPAEIVREIYTMYLERFGFKIIAEKLNKNGKKSPSYYQKIYNNKKQGYNKPAITFRYL